MTFPNTARRWSLVAITLLAAGVRLYAAAQPRVVWGDEPFYLWLGRSLLDGQGYQFFGISGVHFAPLYPLAAGLISKVAALFGAGGTAALMVGSAALHVLAGAALVLPIWGIARRLAGERAGIAAALVTALYPALVVGPLLWGTMSEPLYLLLVGCAWWALIVAVQDGKGHSYVLAGAALALAYLTRTEALVLLLAGLPAALLIAVTLRPGGIPRQRPLRGSLAGAGLALLAFALLSAPYVLAMYAETGHWQLADESGAAYVSANSLAYGDMATFDRATWGLDPLSGEVYLFSPASESESLVRAVRANPTAFVRLLRTNIRDFAQTLVSPRLLPWWLLPLVALGLFAQVWDRRRLRGELMLLVSFVGPLSFLPFFVQDRYIAGALLPALVWTGAGIVHLGDWLAESIESLLARPARTDRFLRILPLALLLVVLLIQAPRLRDRLQVTGSFQPAHLTLAQAVRDAAETPAVRVMSRYPAVAFHAGAAWSPTPAATPEEIYAYARSKGADFMALDANEARLRPQLAFLLDPANAPEGWELVKWVDEGRGTAVLYRLR
jgi:4-amino-4-deoxy-L-arabinose transferase-like glycosyltransferase